MQNKRSPNGQPKGIYGQIYLAYVNIEGMRDKEEEVLREINGLENKPDIIAVA